MSQTALGVARIRAAESGRPDRLFDDPYAAAFVAAGPDPGTDPAERSDAARSVGLRLAFQVVIRTRFYDDYLLGAAADGIRQVVLLAAGLDTRGFRLAWPAGTRLFEVDLPEVAAFKEEVLRGAGATPRCDRATVAADLTSDWSSALAAAGFDPERPTAWLVEGLLVYLSADDAGRLLETVGALSAPGSRLSCEQGRGAAQLAAASAAAGGSGATSLWRGGLGDDVPRWFDARGWATESFGLARLAAGYGRPTESQTQSGFLIATRA